MVKVIYIFKFIEDGKIAYKDLLEDVKYSIS